MYKWILQSGSLMVKLCPLEMLKTDTIAVAFADIVVLIFRHGKVMLKLGISLIVRILNVRIRQIWDLSKAKENRFFILWLSKSLKRPDEL